MSNDAKFIDYSVILADLLAKREGIEKAIQGVIAASGGQLSIDVSATQTQPYMPSGSVDRQPTELPRGAFMGKSLPGAVKLYLSATMKKQTIREIATALRAGGIETTSDNFENVITGCLNRMKDRGEVLRFNDGWALAEFYPAALRSNLAQSTAKAKVAKKKAKKAKNPKNVVSSSPGLEDRILSYIASKAGASVSAKQIAIEMNDVLPSAIALSLGRIAKKRGWHKTPDGNYHVMDKVQEMPKAV